MRKLIDTFVRHPVAPNLAMLIMVLAGIYALSQLTRQLLPTFALNVVTVSVAWTGASAEDVEASVTQPLEDELLGIDSLKSIKSISRDGSSQITLEFPDGTDMGRALERVKERVAQVRNLPDTSEQAVIEFVARSEPVAKLMVSGLPLEQLRPVVRQIERDLRSSGLTLLRVNGLPAEEVAIEISAAQLSELNRSLQDIAADIRAASADIPAGTIGSLDVGRQLRGIGKQRTAEGFGNLLLPQADAGEILRLRDIAAVTRADRPEQTRIYLNGLPAAEIEIRRAEDDDAITMANRLYAWAENARTQIPAGVELTFYSEEWRLVDERIGLMLNNALTGLGLVLAALLIFLNGRVAFWVAVGIPVSVLAALMALYMLGGSINIIALFAMIMTFGIIVDDAIIVSEEAVTLYQQGAGPLKAARTAANRMLAPVTAASLTTIAAFVPLLTLDGITGSILFSIPLIVICVIIASLLECFLVLPGHLRHALQGEAESKPGHWRRRFDVRFNEFRQGSFRRAMEWAIVNGSTTIGIAFAGIILGIGLLAGGRIGFAFFPQPDGTSIVANVRFVAGSPEDRVSAFLDAAERAALAAESDTGEDIIRFLVRKTGTLSRKLEGGNVGHLLVELVSPDDRATTNAEFIRAWQARLEPVPGLEDLLIASNSVGPGGADIEVSFTGASAKVLKAAAMDLRTALGNLEGVNGISDDTTYGKEQLIFELTPAGKAIGLTSQSLGSQLRAAFDGEQVQIFQDSGEEIEVRVRLPETERETLRNLESLPIAAPTGEITSLGSIARLDYRTGFDSLLHTSGLLAVTVTGSVDRRLNNSNVIRGILAESILPEIAQRHGVSWNFGGEAAEQREGLSGIGLALPLSIFLIYIILAWVFESYTWPLVVLAVIPFGVTGALFGHWVMGFDLTMLSIFGMFGMAGIVINDSIILVAVFKELRAAGFGVAEAAIEASVRRFRAVLLTSLTTTLGIIPLLFESALEAQFLKPMIISLGFGLLFGTFLVLFLLPAFLVGIEGMKQRLLGIRSRFPRALVPLEWDADIVSYESAQMTFSDPLLDGNRKMNRNTRQ